MISALEKIKAGKKAFIAKCLMEKGADITSPIDLEVLFWKKPYLKNDKERSALAKTLIQEMDIKFLNYFYNSRVPITSIVKSLKITEQAYTEQMFFKWINSLCEANDRIDIRFTIFQKICSSYSKAGMDIFKLLKHKNLQKSLPTIQNWFARSCLIDNHLFIKKTEGLTLLKAFNEQELYPAVFRKIEAIVNDLCVSFYDLEVLFTSLEKLRCKDECLRQLFEKQKDVAAALKTCFEKHLLKCFFLHNIPQVIRLVCQLIPTWKKSLIAWTKDQIKVDKEVSIHYGREPRHDDIIALFKSLNEVNLLDAFMSLLKSDASEELARDINVVYSQFSKKKNKK